MGFPVGTIVKIKPEILSALWSQIFNPLPDGYFQVLESDHCPFVWVINGGGTRCVPIEYLHPEPFLQAIYYRRWGWWKRLRCRAFRYIGMFYWSHKSVR